MVLDEALETEVLFLVLSITCWLTVGKSLNLSFPSCTIEIMRFTFLVQCFEIYCSEALGIMIGVWESRVGFFFQYIRSDWIWFASVGWVRALISCSVVKMPVTGAWSCLIIWCGMEHSGSIWQTDQQEGFSLVYFLPQLSSGCHLFIFLHNKLALSHL